VACPEQWRQKYQPEERQHRRDQIGELGTGAGGHGDRGLGQTANDEEPAEEAAQNIGGSVRDQFLVWIDVTAALHCRGPYPAQVP
jgi:hypothetical protein